MVKKIQYFFLTVILLYGGISTNGFAHSSLLKESTKTELRSDFESSIKAQASFFSFVKVEFQFCDKVEFASRLTIYNHRVELVLKLNSRKLSSVKSNHFYKRSYSDSKSEHNPFSLTA